VVGPHLERRQLGRRDLAVTHCRRRVPVRP
jgi:hypothetical protein